MKNGKIKVGSIVKALAGPHKGEDHTVIAMTGNGVYNITPVNRKNVKYRLGAAGAKEKDLELVKEESDYIPEETLNESTEVYNKKGVVITRWNMGFDSPLKGRNTAFQIGAGTLGKRSVRDNYVHLTADQMTQLSKDIKSIKLNEDTDISEASKINYPFAYGYLDSVMKDFIPLAKREKLNLDPAQLKEVQKFIDKLRKEAYVKAEKAYKDFKRIEEVEVGEDAELNEGLRHIKTANSKKGTKLFNDIMGHFKLGGRLNKELDDASDGELNKKYDEMYKHLRMAGEIFDDLEADTKMIESVDLVELDLSIDKFVAVAKGTKTKNKFFVFNNKGQVYHTAPTLDKAKKLSAEYKKNPEEMGTATILDLTKGKIVESVELEENAEVARITKLALSMKVGDKTNFGVIKKMGKDYITVKAKDTPETKLKFNQRKSGGRYVLSLLSLMEDIIVNENVPHIKYRNDSLVNAANKILNQKNDK